MTRSILFIIWMAGLVSSSQLRAQTTYSTRFTSGTNLALLFQQGGFTATFSGHALSYFHDPIGYPSSEPSIRNVSAGSFTLNFTQPVVAISFDVGGLDLSWGDKVTFPVAPGSPLLAAQNSSSYFSHLPSVSGTSLIATAQDQGAHVTFAGLGGGAGVMSFNWNDVGTAGPNDWTFYDNFSFTVIPEPSTAMFLSLGGMVWIGLRRKKIRQVR